MKLLKLIIQNFGSIQEATLELKDKGLVSIEGVNQDKTGSDSNGSGKSTVINAILWCLYGIYGKDGDADDVVNSEAGKDCMVQTSWADDGRTYKIIRYRKHSKYKNSIKILQDRIDITKATAPLVQAQINEIMGADETVFRAACFYQQENPLDIPAMKDRELKALLENVLPFEDLEEAYQKATEEVKQERLKLAALESKAKVENATVVRLMEEATLLLKEKQQYVVKCEIKNAEIDENIKAKKSARLVAISASAELENIKKQLAENEAGFASLGSTDIDTVNYRICAIKKRMAEIQEEIREPKTTCYACGQEVTDETTVIEKLQGEYGAKSWELHDLEIDARTKSENLKKWRQLKNERKELENKLNECQRNKEAADRLASEIKLLEGSKANPLDNPYSGSINRLKDALRASKKALDKAVTDALLVKDELEILEAAQLTFSPKGLRYHMLETVAPALTEATNRYLDILTDGSIKAVWSTVSKTAKGDYREKFSIKAHYANREKFGLLSGGEKRKVRLATFFALQEIIAKRATKEIEIWCGDEIDHALDSAGLERLMVLLNEITKRKSTILVISHNELREWIPNYAVVTREDGVSTVTGYLNG